MDEPLGGLLAVWGVCVTIFLGVAFGVILSGFKDRSESSSIIPSICRLGFLFEGGRVTTLLANGVFVSDVRFCWADGVCA